MDKSAYYRRQFAYDAWANREALASLRRAGAPPARAVERMAHIAGAGAVWLARLGHPVSTAASPAVWPQLTLEECQELLDGVAQAWERLLDGGDDKALERDVTYTNSQGEAFTSRVEDVLTHVLLHGAYHRGQIASDLRSAGHTPVLTDFIHAVRQGYIE